MNIKTGRFIWYTNPISPVVETMSIKLDFLLLDVTGKNYLDWSQDIQKDPNPLLTYILPNLPKLWRRCWHVAFLNLMVYDKFRLSLSLFLPLWDSTPAPTLLTISFVLLVSTTHPDELKYDLCDLLDIGIGMMVSPPPNRAILTTEPLADSVGLTTKSLANSVGNIGSILIEIPATNSSIPHPLPRI
jgi:hypothetical protein